MSSFFSQMRLVVCKAQVQKWSVDQSKKNSLPKQTWRTLLRLLLHCSVKLANKIIFSASIEQFRSHIEKLEILRNANLSGDRVT